MRRSALVAILVLLGTAAYAGTPGLVWGVSWGTSVSFASWDMASFLTADRYLAETDEINTAGHFNGFIDAYMGIGTGRNELTINAGWHGAGGSARLFPVMLGWNWFRNADRTEGLFIRTAAGAGFPENGGKLCGLADLGLGIRQRLSRLLSIDYGIGLNTSLVHPDRLTDPYSGNIVNKEDIRSSKSLLGALKMSIRLNF